MITRIRLCNFKSFRDVSVPLGRFTVVLGANGAGKSNLFDVRRLLDLPGFHEAQADGEMTPGELQAEGWINAAVSA